MRILETKANALVRAHAMSLGTSPQDFRDTPLHYPMADLVTGLMLLAEAKRIDFEAVLRDAREGVEEEKKSREPKKKGASDDPIAFIKDFYREYEPCSDVNEQTEKMVARAKALIMKAENPDVRVMDAKTLLCAVHGTPVSANESKPCLDCVKEFRKKR